MNNKYIFIGDDKIAGALEKEKPAEVNYWGGLSLEDCICIGDKEQNWKEYLKSLPRIEVVQQPTHNWKVNQILVEEIDFDKCVIAFGLVTRFWTYDERSGYGCSECCNGDRCDEDCKAKYKGRRKECPHCKGHGWIKKENVEKIIAVPIVKNNDAELIDFACHVSQQFLSEPIPVKEGERLYTEEDIAKGSKILSETAKLLNDNKELFKLYNSGYWFAIDKEAKDNFENALDRYKETVKEEERLFTEEQAFRIFMRGIICAESPDHIKAFKNYLQSPEFKNTNHE